MKKMKKLLALLVAFTIVTGELPVSVYAEGEDVPEEGYVYDAEEAEKEAARQAAEQQAALEAAAEEAARQAAEQAQQQQESIDQAASAENEAWQEIDNATEAEVVQEVEEEPQEVQEEEKPVEEEEKALEDIVAEITLEDGGVVRVVAPAGSVPEGAKLAINQLSDDESKNLADGVTVEGVITDAQVFTISLADKDGNAISAVSPLDINLKNVKIAGNHISFFGVNEASSLIEGPVDNAEGGVNFQVSTNNFKTFVVVATKYEEDSEKIVKDTQEVIADGMEKAFSAASNIVKSNQEAPVVETAEEAQYPAFTASKQVGGTSMSVAVEAPEGAFPEGIQLYAEAVATPKEVLNAIDGDVAQEDIVSIDVHFYLPESPEQEIEPNIPISVTFSNINLNAETVDVYHETEKIAEVNGEGGTLELDSFSTYTFVVNPATGSSKGESTAGDYKAQHITVGPGDSGEARVLITKNDTPITDFTGWTFSGYDESVATIAEDGTGLVTPVALGTTTVTAKAPTGERLAFTLDTYALVKYDLQGGKNPDGTDSIPDSVLDGVSQQVFLTNTTPIRNNGNDTFLGWATSLNPNAPNYFFFPAGYDQNVSTHLFATGDWTDPDTWVKTLYAVWNPKITFNVEKVWDDDNNRDGIRPPGVDIKLYVSRDNGTTWSEHGNGVTLSEGHWTHTFDPRNGRAQHNNAPLWWKVVEETPITDYTTTTSSTGGTASGNEVIFSFADIEDIARNSGGEADITFTNKHEPEIINSISVTKVWDDDDNRDGKRPTEVYARLFKADGTYVGKQSALNEGNGWTNTFKTSQSRPLYKYENGQPIQYTVTESTKKSGNPVPVPEYEMSVTGDVDTGFTITNTHKPEVVEINVTKVWVDGDNRDNTRPDAVYARVYANGEYKRTRRLSEENGWTTTIKAEKQYKYENGQEIQYEVKENWVQNGEVFEDPNGNYVAEITGDVDNGFTFTNTYVPKFTKVTVNKEWVDRNNAGNTRPSSVFVRLMNNGEVVKTANLMEANNWSITFDNVPVFDNEGNEIQYNVDEAPVPGYNTPIVSQEGEPFDGYTFKVVNTIPGTVYVEKKWEDDNDRDGKRPESVEVKLLADGTATGDTLTLTEADGWAGSFTDLAIFNENDEEIVYTIDEVTVDEYETEITGSAEEGFTITNTHEPEIIDSIAVSKVWKDAENQDGIRPDTVYARLFKGDTYAGKQKELSASNGWASTFTTSESNPLYKYENGEEIQYTIVEAKNRSGDPKPVDGYDTTVEGNATDGFTVTNTHKPEVVKINVTKVWYDDNNRDGVRPDEIYAAVYADGERVRQRALSASNNWSTVIEAEQQYKYKPGEVGVEIDYTIEESFVRGTHTPEDPNGNYELVSIDGDVENGFVITNKYEPKRVDINVEKVWNDEDGRDRDGVRPTEVTYILLANGVERDRATVGVADDGTASHSWVGYEFMEEGSEINYTVVEEDIPGYYASYAIDKVAETETDNAQVNVTVTNSYDPEKRTVMVVKNWDDNNDQDGLRPRSVKVTLKANGKDVPDAEGNPTTEVVLNEENGWAHIFEGIYRNDNDGTGSKPIKYTVEEEGVPEYSTTYSDFADLGFITVTNKHKPTVTDIDVEKHWVDNADQDGIRPKSIIFRLMANDVLVSDRVLELSANNADPDNPNLWKGTFTNLPIYENGNEIVYSVEEDVVEGYTPEIGYVGANHPHTHPEQRYVIDYWIIIIPIGHWETVDVPDGPPLFTVVNTHEPETTTLTAEKVWDDANDQDGIRENAASALGMVVRAYVNGEEIPFSDILEGTGYDQDAIDAHTEPKMLFTDDTSSYGWGGIPKYYQGKEITYKVIEEVDPKNDATAEAIEAAKKYTATMKEKAMNVFEITNTYEPKTINVTVNKTWDDADDQDGLRPDYLEVTLHANGTAVKTERLSAGNNWETVFKDLPAYEAGTAIVYTAEEEDIVDYEPVTEEGQVTEISEESGTIAFTNKHEPARALIYVKKIWDDADNQDGVRPNSVRFTLLADGVPYAAVDLTEADATDANLWEHIFNPVPAFKDGKRIHYTVVEESIDDYTETTRHETAKDFDPNTPSPEAEKIIETFGDIVDVVALADQGFTVVDITNKHVPGVKDVTVVKTWDDEDNADGIRPDTVEVTLLADGAPATDAEGNEIKAEVKKDNGWIYTFKAVPIKKDGQDIVYTVEETEVANYKTEYVDQGGEGGYFTIVNKHEVERTSHTVTVTWDDNENQDGQRPDFVKVYLTKDGEKVEGSDVVLSAANGWTYTWADLLAKNFESGEPVDYAYAAVEEVPLENGYEMIETKTEGAQTTIKNQYVPETVVIQGHKVWRDNSDQDGVRPESVTINLYGDGVLVQQQEITAENADDAEGNNWKYEFTDLPKYDNGEIIRYTISEEAVANYTPRIVGYDIYNTYTPGKTFTTVIKLWDDDRNRDGVRPENIIVRLLANGEEVTRASISAYSGWFTLFTDLDMMKDGKEIEYTIVEDAVEDYTSEITGDRKSGFTVKNIHQPERTSITVNKVWDDNNDAKKLRPNSITVNVLVNGIKVETRTLTADENWEATIEGLPKYSNGQEIAYVVSEDAVPGYSATVNGFEITNTLREVPCKVCCDCGNKGGRSTPSSGGKASPKTSDTTDIPLWYSLFGGSIIALAIAMWFGLKRRVHSR